MTAYGGETATVSAPGGGTAGVTVPGGQATAVNVPGGRTTAVTVPSEGPIAVTAPGAETTAETTAVSAPGVETATTFRIVRGQPTAADLAALTAVLLSRMAAAEPYGDDCAGPARTAGWRRPERAAPHRDPRGWRASGSGTG
ncbi:acyl-CoA carboxylase epsilon subunit [Streptomyces microflavus]|uniref:acyl-CoA carboxylase epsilon subunit n=1 Tax=Streptomyces microflavus TaxID=1919 RepID=UPI0033AE7C6A